MIKKFKNGGISKKAALITAIITLFTSISMQGCFSKEEKSQTNENIQNVQKTETDTKEEKIQENEEENDKENAETDDNEKNEKNEADEELIRNIEETVKNNFADTGDYSFAFKEIGTENKTSINNKKSVSASVIKVYIMIELYDEIAKGNIDADTVITLEDGDKASGAGSMSASASGTQFSVEDVAGHMIKESDNTATNMLIRVLGMDNINNKIKELGCTDTELNRKMQDMEKINAGIENYTSVDDLCMIFEKMYEGKCINAEKDAHMIEILKGNTNLTKIPAQLSGIETAHKTGELAGVENDAGIVFLENKPFIVCFMTQNGSSGSEINAIAKSSKEIADILRAQ